ncbi:MAG: putative tape measure protein [Prokaryotic dsDNA virus sp.]|nr:MAG: putative tape measure protein [Prokaryotic dsDNA virus sp.]QDP53809.1 MAG: putative tape measure protein [Prokaryotic dsDNA virus sp.]|tara:strand:+ start:5976 stop:8009 length:2034 start_codon:yes stop_codon:yes gene_type:complete
MAESKLRVDILADVKGFDRAMSKAQSRLSSFGKSATKIGKTMSMNLTLPITLAGTVAVNQAIKFEKLQTTLNVLTGSADEGAKAFERLVAFSAETPFQLADLVQVNNVLMGFGLNAESAFENVKRLGDIAGITGGDLNGIAIAFGQASAEGRLLTRDLRQFINNGVPVIQILAQEIGVAEGEIMDLASQGKITFDVLENAFKNATSEGGKFAGGTKILSQTLGGLLSTLKDNVNIALAEFGQAIAEAFNLSENIPKIAKFIQDLTDKFKKLEPSTQRVLIVFTGITAVAGPLLILVGKLAMGITGLIKVAGFARTAFIALTTAMRANPFILVATAIAGVVLALQKLKRESDQAKLDAFGEGLKNLTLNEAEQKLSKLNKTFEANTKILDENNALGFARKKLIIEDADGTKRKTSELANENTEMGNQIKLLEDFIALKKEEKKVPLETETTTTRTPITPITPVTSTMPGLAPVAGDPLAGLTKSIFTADDMLGPRIDHMKLKMMQLAEVADIVGTETANAFGQMGNNLVNSLGLADTGFEGFAKNLAGTITKLISMLLSNAMASAIAGAQASALATGPGAVFAGPAFMATAIAGVVSAFASIPKFAKGGMVTGATLGMIGEGIGTNRGNPEIVAPLDRLQSMIQPRNQRVEVGGQFSINGQDLVLVLQRANSDRTRLV